MEEDKLHPSLENAFNGLDIIETQDIQNAYYYTHDDLRILLLKEMRGRSVEKLCIELEISYDMIYKIRKGTRHIPSSILDRLGMYKVCDRQYILGYVKIGRPVDWATLWRDTPVLELSSIVEEKKNA